MLPLGLLAGSRMIPGSPLGSSGLTGPSGGGAPPSSSAGAQSGGTSSQTASSGNVSGSFYAERGGGASVNIGSSVPWGLVLLLVLAAFALFLAWKAFR